MTVYRLYTHIQIWCCLLITSRHVIATKVSHDPHAPPLYPLPSLHGGEGGRLMYSGSPGH